MEETYNQYGNDYGNSYESNETPQGDEQSVETVEAPEVNEVAEETTTEDSKDTPKRKKRVSTSGKFTASERADRKALLVRYDFITNTVKNNEGVSDLFLGIIKDITGDAEDIADIAINLTALATKDIKTATKAVDFALSYVASRDSQAGLEESLRLGVEFEKLSDDERSVTKSLLSRVTGADLSELKRTASGLETLLSMARNEPDEKAVAVLNKIRESQDFIAWK